MNKMLRPPFDKCTVRNDENEFSVENYPVNMNLVFSFFPDEHKVELKGKKLFLPSITFINIEDQKEVEWVFEIKNDRNIIYDQLLKNHTLLPGELRIKLSGITELIKICEEIDEKYRKICEQTDDHFEDQYLSNGFSGDIVLEGNILHKLSETLRRLKI